MSQEALTPEQAQAFMRELTELSRKHGIWLWHHWETIIATGEGSCVGYDWTYCEKLRQVYLEATENEQDITPLEAEG